MTMRIAKYLARLGVCSRREAEKLIAQERITVNGEVLTDMAFNVSGDEKILLECLENSNDKMLVPVYYQLSQAENEKLSRVKSHLGSQ